MRDVDSRDVEVVRIFSAITYQNNKIDGFTWKRHWSVRHSCVRQFDGDRLVIMDRIARASLPFAGQWVLSLVVWDPSIFGRMSGPGA
jgi:hypothetical protein